MGDMGWYEREVVPRIVNVTCANRRMAPLRERALEGVGGTVVELGFGSGANLPVYPSAVTRVIAIDPSAVGRKLAAKRLAGSPIRVDFAGIDGERLPLDDASVDNAVSTWTRARSLTCRWPVRELRRVLRPGGRFFFLEHGLSPDPKVARRQHRLDPLQAHRRRLPPRPRHQPDHPGSRLRDRQRSDLLHLGSETSELHVRRRGSTYVMGPRMTSASSAYSWSAFPIRVAALNIRL